MKILVTGATGLVGTKLIKTLFEKGYGDIRVLTRNKNSAKERIPFPVEAFEWTPDKDIIESGALENVDIIFHLAGETVAQRWSDKAKKSIEQSRIQTTKLILDSISSSSTTPKKLISASAIGIYGSRSNEELTTDSSYGDGFLADVCKKWENGLDENQIEGMKTHCLRTGIVLSKEGGALKKMLPPFRMGAAGILGNGKQFMSWIHIDDLVSQYIFLMENESEPKAFNGVSPDPVTNYDFTKALGRALSRPTIFPLPAFMLKTIFGEMSEILIGSQKVLPNKMSQNGFKFQFATIDEAFSDIFKYEKKNEEFLEQFQWVGKPTEIVFDFFSNEKNLEKLTPPFLNFKVDNKSTPELQEGTLINYSLKIRGIPAKWTSRITDWNPIDHFVDEQIKGPYKTWHHTHKFVPVAGGTLLIDRVRYKLPLGFIGKLFAGFFVKRDINKIFGYRQKIINEVYGEQS